MIVIHQNLGQLEKNHVKYLIIFQKRDQALQEQIIALESRVSFLEQFENDDNVIKMGNIAAQLRNKLVRYIKPTLSYRAARDEYLSLLNTEERYQELNRFIKQQDCSLSISDLARQIKILFNDRVSKAHKDDEISEAEIDEVLNHFLLNCDEYSKEAANTVVRFLKIMSERLEEPLIVNLA